MSLPARVRKVLGLEAAPDTIRLTRLATLKATIGAGLNGANTTIVGVDRGDPTRSLTGPVPAVVDPTRSIASITAGTRVGYKPGQTIQDTALTDPTLDPYNGLLLARMKGQ
jgi:hypothetical protein